MGPDVELKNRIVICPSVGIFNNCSIIPLAPELQFWATKSRKSKFFENFFDFCQNANLTFSAFNFTIFQGLTSNFYPKIAKFQLLKKLVIVKIWFFESNLTENLRWFWIFQFAEKLTNFECSSRNRIILRILARKFNYLMLF